MICLSSETNMGSSWDVLLPVAQNHVFSISKRAKTVQEFFGSSLWNSKKFWKRIFIAMHPNTYQIRERLNEGKAN